MGRSPMPQFGQKRSNVDLGDGKASCCKVNVAVHTKATAAAPHTAAPEAAFLEAEHPAWGTWTQGEYTHAAASGDFLSFSWKKS